MKFNKKLSYLLVAGIASAAFITPLALLYKHAHKAPNALQQIANYKLSFGKGLNKKEAAKHYASEFSYASYNDSRTNYSYQELFQPLLKNISTKDNDFWKYQLEISYNRKDSSVEEYKQYKDPLFTLKNKISSAPIDVLKQTHNIYYHSYSNDFEGKLYLNVLLEDKNGIEGKKDLLQKSTSNEERINSWAYFTFELGGFKKLDPKAKNDAQLLQSPNSNQHSLITPYGVSQTSTLNEVLNSSQYKTTINDKEVVKEVKSVAQLYDLLPHEDIQRPIIERFRKKPEGANEPNKLINHVINTQIELLENSRVVSELSNRFKNNQKNAYIDSLQKQGLNEQQINEVVKEIEKYLKYFEDSKDKLKKFIEQKVSSSNRDELKKSLKNAKNIEELIELAEQAYEKAAEPNNNIVSKFFSFDTTNSQNKLLKLDNKRPIWFSLDPNDSSKLIAHYYVIRYVPDADKKDLKTLAKHKIVKVNQPLKQEIYINYFKLKEIADSVVEIKAKDGIDISQHTQEGKNKLNFTRNSSSSIENSSKGYFDELVLEFNKSKFEQLIKDKKLQLSSDEQNLNHYTLAFETDNFYKPIDSKTKEKTKDLSPFVGEQNKDEITFVVSLKFTNSHSKTGISQYWKIIKLKGFKEPKQENKNS